MSKICVQCGREFDPPHPASKLCSDECKRARQRSQIYGWQKSHIDDERLRKRRAAKSKKHKPGTLVAECHALGYGPDYGRFMTDRFFGRI